MIYLSGCHHFKHDAIRGYTDRPWDTVDEMDSALIENWNEVVGGDDELYHLGDFTLGDWDDFIQYTWRLNGRIKIVPGNHDWRWMRGQKGRSAYSASGHEVEVLPPLYNLQVPSPGNGKRPLTIVLCHFALRVWHKSHHASFHCYSHSHGRLSGYGRSMDVGVDANDYAPVSLETVIERLSKERNFNEL